MPSYFGPAFDRIIRWAKQFVPFTLRTQTNLMDDDKDKSIHGLTIAHPNGKFTIWLDRNQTHDSACHSLLHELAHCTDHLQRGLTEDFYKDHGPSFDRHHGRWYRAYWKWIEEQEIS